MTVCMSETITKACGVYDGGCGPVLREIRKTPLPSDTPLTPDRYEVYPLDVEDPNRYWTRLCERCIASVDGPYQERALRLSHSEHLELQ